MVEEAVKGETAALAALEARGGGGAGGQIDEIAIGSRVRMRSGTAGELLELRGDGKAVIGIGSMKVVVEPEDLVVVGPVSRQEKRSHSARGATAPLPPTARESFRARPPAQAATEIDLRGLTSDEAEAAVVLAIDEAVLAEQPYLRIIHGKGTGALRERVRQIVESDGRVARSAFAAPNQGGSGVTVVEFDG
jgi:DNA mismatch repair protein MutS2